MSQRVYFTPLSKLYGAEAQGNRVLIGLLLRGGIRPEARRACPDQDEAEVKLCGGPNRLVVQNLRMN